ncbi:MAG TPA: hypothetical protein VGR65_08265 [Casimicrobiaceae bacterium]|jgi:hypothetical protein|nr:hypothetical protein [Casimicrobiaceae bacterium]
MSRSLQQLAARKQILLAQSQLQRMQFALYAGDARDALRPAGLMGGAIARPAAAIALVNMVARLFGWRRLARVVRFGAIALVVFRFVRMWRTRAPSATLQPELFP